MPRSLQELLTQLRGLFNEFREANADVDAVKAVLADSDDKGGWAALRQSIFDEGHQAATAQNGQKLRQTEGLLTTATETIKQRDARIKELEGKAPEAQQLQTQYEADMNAEKQRNKAREEELASKLLSERRAGRLTKLAKILNTKYNVHDERDVEVARQHEDRIHFDDKEQLVIKQLGKDIPYAGTENEDQALEALAKDISKTLKPWSFRSGVGRGAGIENGGGAGNEKVPTPETITEAKRLNPEYQAF